MPDLDTIAAQIHPHLVLRQGETSDLWLCEHTRRVMGLVQHLCAVPELAEDPPDETAALLAAACANLGWVSEVTSGALHPGLVLHRPTNEQQREAAVNAVPSVAANLVPKEVIQLAQEAIRQSHVRDSGTPEAQVLAEAESLADMGLPYILRQLRRYAAEGRTTDELLASWNRQHEYHFWEARINDGLRFETSRQLARTRLEAARECVTEMERQLEGADFVGEGARELGSEGAR